MKGLVRLAVFAAVMGLASTATAQNQKELVPDEVENKGEGKEPGWYPRLILGASLSFAHSDNVVGQQNGQSWSIGPQIDFNIDYYGGPHEWRNHIGIHEVFTMTPVIPDVFIKTTDSLEFESVYLYHVGGLPWFGPFVRSTMDTSMFPTKDIQANDHDYVRKGTHTLDDKSDAEVLKAGTTRYDLTNAFAPFKLTQSVGAFATPLDKPIIKLEFRIGIGAREVLVQDGEALSDDDATTDLLEVVQLEDFIQAGGELFVGANGTLVFDNLGKDRPLLYSIGAEILMPFYTDIDTDKSGVDLTAIEFQAKLGVKLFTWMSLDYALKLVREPLIVEDLQISNNLLLNFSYALID